VGERLSTPLQIPCLPRWTLHPVAVATAAIARIRIMSAFAINPDHSRDQRRGGSVELFAATSFDRIATRRTSEAGTFSAPRMRTPRGPSRTLWSLHRIVSISDVSVVTCRHTRVEILFARCAGHHPLVDTLSRAVQRRMWS